MAGDDDGKRVNIGVRLLPATVAALDDAGARMGGRSRAFVIEVLTALHAGRLDGRTAVPVGMLPAGSRAKKVAPAPSIDPPARKPRGRPKKTPDAAEPSPNSPESGTADGRPEKPDALESAT